KTRDSTPEKDLRLKFSGYQMFVVALLAFLQFSIVLDFMIISPLGAIIIPDLNISPQRFGEIVSAYAFQRWRLRLLGSRFRRPLRSKEITPLFLFRLYRRYGAVRTSAQLSAAPRGPNCDRPVRRRHRLRCSCDRHGSLPSSDARPCDGDRTDRLLRQPGLRQGNRISKLSDKLGQVFVIPACELELSTQGRLGVVLSHDIESHVAQDGEIVGSIVEAISGLILVHNDVEAPMEPIFDAPMGTHYIREALGGQGCAEKVIGCLSRGLGGEFTDADDFADGRQSGPLMPLLEPSDIGRDEGDAGFDPTVIAIDRLIGGGGCSLKLWVVEELFDIGMQRALVAFERQGVIALLIDDLLGDVALAVEGINRHGAAFQR